ncbi:family 16 glycosylhydrolase, partial [bacterium]|nr:family 16 glycosylhydrolase [bacterium]
EYYFNGACHWGEGWNGGSYPNKAVHTTNSYSLQNDFHLYTLIWNKDSIKMYLDMDKYPNVKPYFEMPIVGNEQPNETSRYFRKPQFIIFNLAVGGTFPDIY